MNVRPRHAAVRDIADDGDAQVFERLSAVEDGQSVEQLACVGYAACVPSPALTIGISRWRARKCGAPEAACRITMALGRIATRVLSVSTRDSPFRKTLEPLRGNRNGLRAELPRGNFETYARASGSLKKEIDDHLAAQRIESGGKTPFSEG